MKKNRIWIIVLALLPIAAGATVHPDRKWQFVEKREGISIYKSEVESSSLLAFRGTGVVGANISQIMAALTDTKPVDEEKQNVVIRTISEISELERLIYIHTKAPWPLQDREMVGHVKVRIEEKESTVYINVQAIRHDYRTPQSSKRVRLTNSRVVWSFTPISKDKVWVEISAFTDPGGWIPTWAMNLVSKQIPFDNINGLRWRIASGKIRPEYLARFKDYKNWGLKL